VASSGNTQNNWDVPVEKSAVEGKENIMDELTQQILKELKRKIVEKYDLCEMRVFGSTARGDRREDSDIDVFIRLRQVDRRIEEDLFDMAYDMELKYDCLIDLIVFSDKSLEDRFARTPICEKVLFEGAVV